MAKQLVTEKLATLDKKSLEDILCTWYHSAQSGICSVTYTILKQVMLELFRKDVIGEALNDHKLKFFDIFPQSMQKPCRIRRYNGIESTTSSGLRVLLLKVYKSRSATVRDFIGAQRKALHFKSWGVMRRHWRDYNGGFHRADAARNNHKLNICWRNIGCKRR